MWCNENTFKLGPTSEDFTSYKICNLSFINKIYLWKTNAPNNGQIQWWPYLQGQIPWYQYKDLVTRNAQEIQCQGQKVKIQQNDLITRNIHVKFYLQSTSSLMDSLTSMTDGYFEIQGYNAMLLLTICLSSNPVDAASKNPDVGALYFHVMSHGGLQSAVQV